MDFKKMAKEIAEKYVIEAKEDSIAYSGKVNYPYIVGVLKVVLEKEILARLQQKG